MEPKPTGFTISWWAKVLMVVVTVVLLGLGTVYLMGIAERGRWERYAASLRDAGSPLTFKEIEARRADVPDERNSAPVIISAIKDFPPPFPPPSVLLLGRRPPEDDLLAGIPRYAIDDSRAFLEVNRPVLDALRPVMDMPTGRIAIAYAKNPFETLLPSLSGLRNAAKLARLDAILRLVDGDAGGAVDATILQLHIAGSLNEYPTVIGHLVELACDRLGIETAQDILRSVEAPEADLVRLRKALVMRRRADPMRWGMWSERASAVEVYNLIVSGEVKLEDLYRPSDMPIPSSKLLPEYVIRKNQLRAVEMLTRLVDAGDDLTAMREAAAQMETEIMQLGQTYFIVKMLMPSLGRAVFLQIEHDTVLDCTLAGIAAERFRLATGHWPASLDRLVPAYLDRAPPDPFGEGAPLKLVATNQGIVIYSVGEDTIDDGGDVVPEKKQRAGPDLGFRLLDPEHRRVHITDEPRPEGGD